MVDRYLQELETLLDSLRASARDSAVIEARHFFSGAAAYADGRIFMSLTPAGLALKLAEADCADLRALGGRSLQYFPKAPVKKDYVVVPDDIAGDPAALSDWIGKSVGYALTLPKPRKKAKSGGR